MTKNKELTTKEAGLILGVSASRIRQFILAGRLPAVKRGRDLFVLEKDLEPLKHRPHRRGE